MVVRTTITLDSQLLEKVRELAAANGWSLSHAITELVQASMAKRADRVNAEPFRWPTFRGEVLPGVDIGDRDRLYEIMEGRS